MSAELPLYEFGNPHAPPVMLLHPGGALHSVWLPLTRAWQNHYRLLAPDLIQPPSEKVSLQNLAAQVITLLQQHASTPVWLIGSSLGANVALLVAINAPQVVAGLVLDSAQAGGPPPTLLPLILRLLKGMMRVTPSPLVTSLILSQFRHYEAADKLALRAEIEMIGKLGVLEQVEAHFDYDVRPSLKNITAPTLILAGEQDTLTKAGAPQQLQAGIPSAVLRVIPKAGHVTFLQQPVLFQHAATDFVAKAGVGIKKAGHDSPS